MSALCATGLLVGASADAQGASLAPGVYKLENHPDGTELPPPYGARFDELYDVTSGHDIFTLDFEAPGSSMWINVTASSISIYGVSRGGRDIGGAYAADAYNGLYTINFTYSLGVSGVPGDDDTWVDTTNHANSGTILTPLNDTINLVDERGTFDHSFRLGDENNDLGHRGFTGISGWGWLSYLRANGQIEHIAATDWLFTVVVPAPGTAGVLGLAALVGLRRRR